jgi:hypothetical protein
MKTLLGKKLLPFISLSLLVGFAPGCDEGEDEDTTPSGMSEAGKSGGGGGKGGSSAPSDEEEGGSGGSTSEGGKGGSASGGKGGSGGSGSEDSGEKCDPEANEIVNVNKNITEDTTWDCGTYLLQDIIAVTDDATLTIKPGAVVLGDTDIQGKVKALVITRGAKIDAKGTKDEPIVFTSGNPEGARTPGDWGGVVLLGKATVNKGNCEEGTGDACSGGFLQGNIEGLNPNEGTATYGGTDDAHSCGTLEYVRIEYAGYQLSPDNELNGLTVGGCGTGTKLSHIQVHRGSDDGIEFFGGTAGMDHVVLSGASDDSLDWDLGWRGKAQFVVIHQATNDGDKGIEADSQGENESAEPRSKPELWNFTMIGNPAKTALLLREGTRGTIRNFIIQDFAIGVDLAAMSVDLSEEWPDELSLEESVFSNVKEAGDADAEDDDKGFNEGEAVEASDRKNVFDVDAEITSKDLLKPDYKPKGDVKGKATPGSGFDTKATYAGAMDPDGDDWTKGWTDYSEN